MQRRGLTTLAAAGLFLSQSACRSLVEVVDYVDCFPVDGAPYLEGFTDESFEPLAERCWKILHEKPKTDVLVDGEDLILRPNATAGWSDEGAAPLVSLLLEDDFVFIARAEFAQGIFDHCPGPADAAGIAAENANDGAWTTFLLQPSLDVDAQPEECADDVELSARARVKSNGFDSDVDTQVPELGEDGEADIALCRLQDQLVYYYRDVESMKWIQVPDAQQTVDLGPMNVGLTVTVGDTTLAPEGHFNWAAVYRTLGADSCAGTLENFTPPEDP